MANKKIWVNPYKEKEVDEFKKEWKERKLPLDPQTEEYVAQKIRDVIERVIKRGLMNKFPITGLNGEQIMVVTWDDLFEGLT